MAGYIPPAKSVADLELAGKYNPALLALSALNPILEPFDTGDTTIFPPPLPAINASWGVPWGGSSRKQRAIGLRYKQASQVQLHKTMPWGDGEHVDALRGGGWEQIPARDLARTFPWDDSADPRDRTLASGYEQVPPKDLQRAVPWDLSIRPRDLEDGFPYLYPPSRDLQRLVEYTHTRPAQADGVSPGPVHGAVLVLHNGPYVPGNLAAHDPVLEGKYLPPETTKYQPPELERFYRPRDSQLCSGYAVSGIEINLHRTFPWGAGQYLRHPGWGLDYDIEPGDPYDKIPGQQPDIREYYFQMNVVNVFVLPGYTPVEVRDIELSLDVDSWAWTFRGTVRGQATLDLVKPTGSGPVDLEIQINGHSWVVMVERYSGERKIADDLFSISGSSRTQYLAAPYAPKLSAINGSSLTAKQAIEDLLQFTGYTLAWTTGGDEDTPDWTFSAGQLAYVDKTVMEVIKMIADAAGAIVQPALDEDEIIIKPRFPTPPWGLGSAIMDKIITAAMVRSMSEEWVPQELYNYAYVSGINTGRGTEVTRQGTAGDQPAPDVFSELQVAVEPNTARGEMIIADSGNRSQVTLEQHLNSPAVAPGLVLPGHEVEYQPASGSPWRGYVMAVTISAPGTGAAPVWQKITINRPLEH